VYLYCYLMVIGSINIIHLYIYLSLVTLYVRACYLMLYQRCIYPSVEVREYYRNLSSSPELVSSQADDVNLCDRATTNDLTHWGYFKLNQRLIDLIKANRLIKRSVVSKVCTM